MAYRKIVLKSSNNVAEEAFASAALNPGHLVALASTGKVAKHATEGGRGERLFAKESVLQGRGIDTAYAQDELVFLHVGQPGDEVYAYIKAGQNIAIGEQLISAGDGTLESVSDDVSGVTINQVFAVALEAVDLTGSGAVATRTRVRLV